MDEDDDEDYNVPTVVVGSQRLPITEIDESVVAKMTSAEQETYIQICQDYYTNVVE